MDDFHDSVMIALLPTTSYWCQIELPHMTLVYAGLIQDLPVSTHNELAKVALSLAMTCAPITLDVLVSDVFGDEDLVDVLVLRPAPELLAMRSMVEYWNRSEHPFKPHVTVGPIGSLGDNLPAMITFDQIMVAWGDSKLTYKLFRL